MSSIANHEDEERNIYDENGYILEMLNIAMKRKTAKSIRFT